MKLFFALTALSVAVFASVNPQLHQVKRVYILAMGGGMDQFLANQLATAGIFEVVTDPKKADAIISDNVGEAFEQKLDDLYAPPAPPLKRLGPAPKPSGEPGTPIMAGDGKAPDLRSPPNSRPDEPGLGAGGANRSGSFGRGKGTVFVVDRNSRVVLWSVYERPKDRTPHELAKTAARVVKHLKDDLTDKKPAE